MFSYKNKRQDKSVEYGLNQEFDSLLDLDKKEILFNLGYCCLKLSSFIRSLIYDLILSSIWNRSDSPFVCGKKVQSFSVLDIPADSNFLYKHSASTKNQREREESVCVCEREKGSLFIWFFNICGLQFGIVREVCYRLCRVTNCGPNPKGIGYRPNKPNTINL